MHARIVVGLGFGLVGAWEGVRTGKAMFRVACMSKQGQVSIGLPLNTEWKPDKMPMKPGTYKIAKGELFGMGSIYDNRADLSDATGTLELKEFDATHMVGTFTFTASEKASQPKEKDFGKATVTGAFTLSAPKK